MDQARRKLSVRHGGEWRRVPELPEIPDTGEQPEQSIVLHELLDRFAAKTHRQAEVAKMRLLLQMHFQGDRRSPGHVSRYGRG